MPCLESHLLIFSASRLPTFSTSYLLSFPSSNLLNFIPSELPNFSSSLCHFVTLSLCHFVTLSPCHLVTLSLCNSTPPSLRRSRQFSVNRTGRERHRAQLRFLLRQRCRALVVVGTVPEPEILYLTRVQIRGVNEVAVAGYVYFIFDVHWFSVVSYNC